MSKSKSIYCAGCEGDVKARLTDGGEVYPHRPDLSGLPFWKCDVCGNFVGCHHKTKNRTQPLGCIPTVEMRSGRKQIHALIDPIWREGRMSRRDVYSEMTRRVGWTFHTAKTRSLAEVKIALAAARAISGAPE